MNETGTFDRDLERWLEAEAPTAAPAGLHAAVVERARVTGQRPGWLVRDGGPAPRAKSRSPGRRWLLVVATLAVGTGVVGASLIGGRLLTPTPEPTLPVAVVSPTTRPSPDPSASVAPYRAASWTATGSADRALNGTATLLHDGRVLVAGGSDFWAMLDVAQLYDPETGTWTVTGAMVTPRARHTATLLADGRVLITGGHDDNGGQLASAELYDPGTGSWTATGSMHEVRAGHSATLLPDGKVLVAGMDYPSGTSAELYDPGTGSWTTTGSMGTRRSGAPATLLPDGRVLVVGGDDYGSDTLASAELYDPDTGSWTATGSMHEVRAGHSATLLPDGRVLVAGGVDTVVYAGAVGSAELYDPGTESWTAAGSMVTPRRGHSATLLPNGRVLVAGGVDTAVYAGAVGSAELYDPGTGSWTATASMISGGGSAVLLRDGRVLFVGGGGGLGAELYDPGSGTSPTPATNPSPPPSPSISPTLGTCGNPGEPDGPASGAPGWILTGNMTTARSQHIATLLRDGKVLVTGGSGPRRVGTSLEPPVSAELYDPSTRAWTATGSMAQPRTGHTATLLPDGRVLVAGGYTANDSFASAELYDPGRGTWTATGSMIEGRRYHTATLLPDGKVLVAGGMGNGVNMDTLASAELYDPASGTWTATGGMTRPRVYHKATLLADGRVLVTIGINQSEGGLGAGDVYDPGRGTWAATRKMVHPGQGDSATLLPDGKVLVAGGSSGTSAMLYNPRNGTWTATGSMLAHRRNHTATLLPDGTVLVTGGEYEATGSCTSAELYDPGSGSWTATSNLVMPHFFNFTATLLADGTVLVAGGNDYGSGILASAELYDPGTH